MTPGNEFKHKVEIPKRFMRSFKPLSEEMKQRVMEKIQELSMGHIGGEPLKEKSAEQYKYRFRLTHGSRLG
jgi:mRNA-degrading endonuclease RelE of RelBE toxin-antitoxin system